MNAHNNNFNTIPSRSFNVYSSAISLENSLLLANDRIKSLECLLASKDFIIYQMSVCNAFMAQATTTPNNWKPPLPNCPPPKERYDEEAHYFKGYTSSPARADGSKFGKPHLPAERDPFVSSKAANVESQVRQGGGGSRLIIDPRHLLLPRPCL